VQTRIPQKQHLGYVAYYNALYFIFGFALIALLLHFILPRAAIPAWYMLWPCFCSYVRPSLSLSQTGVLSGLLSISSHDQCHVVARKSRFMGCRSWRDSIGTFEVIPDRDTEYICGVRNICDWPIVTGKIRPPIPSPVFSALQLLLLRLLLQLQLLMPRLTRRRLSPTRCGPWKSLSSLATRQQYGVGLRDLSSRE